MQHRTWGVTRFGARRVDRPLWAFWAEDRDRVLERLGAASDGLTSDAAAAARRRARGSRRLRPGRSRLRLLLAQFASPIMLVLIGATIISMLVGDAIDGAIIVAIIAASGVLGYWQEQRAHTAVAALLATVQVTVPVLRDGAETAVPVAEVVPGDVVLLRAGGVVPGDCRLLESENLLVDESTLSGESFPVEKDARVAVAPTVVLAQRRNSLFLGTHVVSGTGRAVIVLTGRDTLFGAVSADLQRDRVTTAFADGTRRFGILLITMMAILTTFILAVNVVLGRPLIESVLFSLALAVGLSPQMLPAIVALSLAAGARRLAAARVIVTRLEAIEDLGAMTVLCTDKTGTLTTGTVTLVDAVDLAGGSSANVLELAALNAGLQRGYTNPVDAAVLAARAPAADARALDELPYDFHRRMLTVLVAGPRPMIITKGAVDSVLDRCTQARAADGGVVPLSGVEASVRELVAARAADGARLLALATREREPGAEQLHGDDETDLVLEGLLLLSDEVKPDAAGAVAELQQGGVSVRIVSGDARLTAQAVARRVGIPADRVITGADMDGMTDSELQASSRGCAVFAEVEPLQKARVIRALRADGETVGYLGDGINDAPALHAADAGISVDTAADVAKQSASLVLLENDLGVIARGVLLGRETFANTLKYVRVTTSANFGNMLSMAAASLFLPFLPLLPRQILLLNFLSDIPATTIAADAVDPERTAQPGTWDIPGIRRFMIVFGLLSTVFDLATFAVLLLLFQADETLFRSAWFIESTLTEIVVLLSLRTARPVWASRPGRGLLIASIAMVVVAVALPFTPVLGPALGLAPLPLLVLASLAGLTTVYLAANELLKRRVLLVAAPPARSAGLVSDRSGGYSGESSI